MIVKVDKRIEFINMLQQISDCEFKKDFPQFFNGATKYLKKIFTDFGNYKNHEAVKLFSSLNGFTFGRPLDYALTLDDNFCPSGMFYGKGETFDKLALVLPSFAKEIKFDEWFKGNISFYNQITQDYSKFLQESQFEDFMKRFYKADYDDSIKREFCLMPSLGRKINFHKDLSNECEKYEMCCVSVADEIDEKPVFVVEESRKSGCAHTAVHEFSHGIINPMVFDYFDKHEFFSIETDKTKEKKAYFGKAVFCDTIIEGVLHTYMREKGLTIPSNNRLNAWAKEEGFIFIEPVIDCLQDYTSHIDEYSAFSEYFPKVIDRIAEEKEKSDLFIQ